MNRSASVLILSVIFSFVDSQIQITDLLTGGACGQTIQEPGGIVVSHQPFDTIPPISNDFICFLQMWSFSRGQRIRFMFSFFSLTPNDCSMTNLTFFDGRNDMAPVVAILCPDTMNVLSSEYVSTGRWLTMKLQVSSASSALRSANFSGFFATYTEGIDPCQDPSIEFMCDNGRCINQTLECDGLNTCGDNSDESNDAPSFCDGTTTTSSTTNSATTIISNIPTTIISNIPTTTLSISTTSVITTTFPTSTINTESALFSDLTPLYIILTIAFALLITYVIYILLSYQWFKTLMMSCLHRCFVFGIRQRRLWKEDKVEKSKKSGKISPQPSQELTLDDISITDNVAPPINSKAFYN